MNLFWESAIVWLAFSGLIGFAAMGIDKARALDRSWRVPERVLLILALAGGALGVIAGAFLFHHKTSKPRFLGAALLLAVLWLAVLALVQRALGPPFA